MMLVRTIAAALLVLLKNDAAMATDMEVGVGGNVEEVDTFGETSERAQLPEEGKNETKVWPRTVHTLDEFVVAGYNLAAYFGDGFSEVQKMDEDAAPFELYENFDISDRVTGNEDWDGMITHRQLLERPDLRFYIDKVARKRWLPVMGYEQPKPYALVYADEFEGSEEEVRAAFKQLLPQETGYVAKPSHMSSTKGTWVVSQDKESGKASFSQIAATLSSDEEPDQVAEWVAYSLTNNFNEGPHDFESWILKHVNPGAIVEERFADFDNENAPPGEFNMFTIWGKLWVGQYNYVLDQSRWCAGFIYPNGTMTAGSGGRYPSWVDWPHLVKIAEELGANKDMFRTDIFVGVPAGEAESGEERRKAIKYAVSESEIYPTTIFTDDIIAEEAARLWIAGYKLGIYRTIPNNEIPQEFIDNGGFLSADWDTELEDPE